MSAQVKCSKCNQEKTDYYSVLIKESGKGEESKKFCLKCWIQEEKNYRERYPKNTDNFYKEVIVSKIGNRDGYVDFSTVNWDEKKKKWFTGGEEDKDVNPFIDGEERGRLICTTCCKKVKEGHERDEENRVILKHDCQPKCSGLLGASPDGCGKIIKLTQNNVHLLWGKSVLPKCPGCQITELKRDISCCYNEESKKNLEKTLKELEKLTGENNDNPQERERERESNSTTTNWDTVIRSHY